MNKRLIYAEDAIDAIEQLVIPEDMCVFEILSHIELAIGTLPSAQPEKMQLSKEDATKGTTFDCISRQAAIEAMNRHLDTIRVVNNSTMEMIRRSEVMDCREIINGLPSAQPRWIPVTPETLPNLNSVVVVCGKKGTWDYGTYRGCNGDIHSWQWKKNTIKHVYWWMYKADALPEQYEGEQDENN